MSLATEQGSGSLAYHLVSSQVTVSGVRAGTLVLVDSAVSEFAGDGFYLYPDWGNPVVYEVKARSEKLAFYYPGQELPLWEMLPGQDSSRFSGRVEGILSMHPEAESDIAGFAAQGIQQLDVPKLPVAR
jgi:hypothetical protein